jgi:hypothetical protein
MRPDVLAPKLLPRRRRVNWNRPEMQYYSSLSRFTFQLTHLSEQNVGRAFTAIACLLMLVGRGLAIEAQIEIRLAIPECNLVLNPDDRTELPLKEISTLIVKVRPKSGSVRYGSIRVLLNGESMNRDTTVKGVEGGYDCVIESGRGAPLPLHIGENLIEISLTDTWNHTHKANFRVVIPSTESSRP